MTELLLRPDHGKQAYRLRCRFSVGAYLDERSLEKAKYAAAGEFVKDMAKRGFHYLDKHGFEMTGPHSPVEAMTLPKRRQQEQWHIASAEMMAAAQAGVRFGPVGGGYARAVTPVAESEKWEYELSGVFIHNTLRVEYPDEHEEREVLRHA